jgi:hypothetical protein
MEGIKIVAVLVKCTQSLLICEDIDTSAVRFADIEHCTQGLPQLIAAARQEAGTSWVVMGKCRFRLDTDPETPFLVHKMPSG